MLPMVPSTLPDAACSPGRFEGSARIGEYELIRLLGLGGMGEVHLARDLRLGRLVAIKLLSMQQPELGELFLAEARVTARCHHENIVVIHEVGEHEGRPYMVLEYLEGQTLRQWMFDHEAAAGSGARVSPARAVELMLPVMRALAYAHEQGIVHRDLKPENVMLTRAGVTKVLDFGIAKVMSAPVPDPGSAGNHARPAVSGLIQAGTPLYMSPEQLNLCAIDHRIDVWAAGIMLFELVAGAHPLMEREGSLVSMLSVADVDTPMPSASERVPEIGPLGAIIDRCLIKAPAHRTPSARVLLTELDALALGRLPVVVGDDGSPFAGLSAFQEADAGRFFGRDRDIAQVIAELRGRPLVAVVGPSGAGKSSLVRAGVIPALKRSGEGWDAHVVRPGREPLVALAGVLAHMDSAPGSSASGAALDDGANPVGLRPAVEQLRAEAGYLGARLRARATSKRRSIAVFVDQLEELYTLGVAADERGAFLACLAAVADDVTSPLRVLVSMRSDFLDRLTEDRRFGAEVARGLVLLPPMDRDGMREALLRPVEASEHRFEPPALIDRMIDAVAVTPGALPLLQFTAARLWERRDRDRRLLTEASYDELGGVAGTLAAHADAVLAGLASAQQALARAVLERLVTPERTRAPVSMAELHALHHDRELVDGLVQHLAAMRLVVIERGVHGADGTVELVHESLIDRWPTLVRWLDENQGDAAMLARLRGAARDWERGDHAAGLLWTRTVAAEASVWRQRYQGELAPAEQRYLAAVLAAADRARRVRRWLFGGILATTLLIAIAMTWLARQQTEARGEAVALARQERAASEAAVAASEAAAQEARRSRDAARMAALRALSDDPTTQLTLLREIEDLRAPPQGAAQEAKRLLHAGIALAVLRGHDNEVFSAAFSPDGRRIVSASADKTVRVWNADGSGEPLILRGHDDLVGSAAFSPDGHRIVSESWDGTARVWNTDGSGKPVILRSHDDRLRSAAFSPDGRRIVSVSSDKTVRVWNADGSGEPLILRGHDDVASSAAFSPDGQRIVSASWDRTVRVWNTDGSGKPVILRGHDDKVWAGEFSPDGRSIVSASEDKTVRVWNADGSGKPVVLRHADAVSRPAFSPDGRRIIYLSEDKTVRVWNADGSGKPVVLRGHKGNIVAVAFSPDGHRVVSASQDKTLRVWNADGNGEPLILRGHDGDVTSAAFSPDGRRIVSASRDRTMRVWNVDRSSAPVILRGHDDGVRSAAFSPDGRRIVSASGDETVRVWNADGSGAPVVLRGHVGVSLATFSPDGQRIISTSPSWETTVRVWNADGSGAPLIQRGHINHGNLRLFSIWRVAFSSDRRRIVSAFDAKVLQVWSTDGSGTPVILSGHNDAVRSAAFSPDDRRVVSASTDKTVRIWNADGGGIPVVLRHDDAVRSAAFSPDGQRVVSASEDKTVRVWNADGSGVPVVLRHDDAVSRPAFSPDGRRIIYLSADKTVRIRNADGSGTPVVLRHDDAVYSVAFSPDGRRLVSASKDRTLRIWQVDGTGEPVILAGHDDEVREAHFSPDGGRIVSASDDKTVRVWRDLTPTPLDDPRLWAATSNCMSVERRIELLGMSEAQALRDRQRCLEHVERARASERP